MRILDVGESHEEGPDDGVIPSLLVGTFELRGTRVQLSRRTVGVVCAQSDDLEFVVGHGITWTRPARIVSHVHLPNRGRHVRVEYTINLDGLTTDLRGNGRGIDLVGCVRGQIVVQRPVRFVDHSFVCPFGKRVALFEDRVCRVEGPGPGVVKPGQVRDVVEPSELRELDVDGIRGDDGREEQAG